MNATNSSLSNYVNSIYNHVNVNMTRFSIEADRMCIEYFDKNNNSYAFRVGISTKEIIVDTVINGVFNRNKII